MDKPRLRQMQMSSSKEARRNLSSSAKKIKIIGMGQREDQDGIY